MTTNYGYDSRNHACGVTIEHKDGANVLDGFTYALDDVGNITSPTGAKRSRHGGNGRSGSEAMRAQTTHEDGAFWDYGYDGRYRLTSAVRSNFLIKARPVSQHRAGALAVSVREAAFPVVPASSLPA